MYEIKVAESRLCIATAEQRRQSMHRVGESRQQ